MSLRRLALRAAQTLCGPLLTERQKLPFEYWIYRLGGAEPELVHLESFIRERAVALDIGANVGFYAYRLSKLFSEVIAFEINPGLVKDLAACNPGNIKIITKGLSSAPRDATLHIPVMNGIKLGSWASLQPDNCPSVHEHETLPVRVETLDSFAIQNVSFIKIDVEGHELEVLQGAVKTLESSRPVTLIEVRDCNLVGVRSFFAGLGYVEETFPFQNGESTGNHIFAPEGAAST